jgi:hypothetical protein
MTKSNKYILLCIALYYVGPKSIAYFVIYESMHSVLSESLVTTASMARPRLHMEKVASTCEGESVNRSQMDIKRKIYDTRTWKKHSFLYISSANIHTLVPSLYQRVETRCIEIF